MPRLRLLLALFVPLLASCGLISSDIDNFKLGLPERQFTVDTADWMLQGSGTVPSVPCSAGCNSLSSMMCASSSTSCSADCDTASSTCEGKVTVAIRTMTPINLAVERPELQTLSDTAQINVTVDSVDFTISENTLTMATPSLEVYFAPYTVTDWMDPQAKSVGTIASIPAMTTKSGSMTQTADQKAAMEKFMNDYRTPFNIIIAGTVAVKAGDMIPSGRLVGTVTATAHADLIK